MLSSESFFISHPYDFYSTYLKTIRDKEFTFREMDVIACIACGRSSTLSSFLSIAPKTASAHISKILQKIQGNSREDIINFVENSQQRCSIRKYYSILLIYFSFENFLYKKFSLSSSISLPLSSRINTRNYAKEWTIFAREIERYLLIADVRISVFQNKNQEALKEHIESNPDKFILLSYFSHEEQQLCECNNYSTLTIKNISSYVSDINIIILYKDKINLRENHITVVDFNDYSNFYVAIFEILKILSPEIDTASLSAEFMQHIQASSDISEFNESKIIVEAKKRYHSTQLFLIGGVVLLSLFLSFIFFLKKEPSILVRSHLIIPQENIFLQRSDIVQLIEKILNKKQYKERISSIAITGIGGTGKTVIARYYAKTHPASVTWEINAETKETLINSFKELAYTFAKNKELKEELTFILQIQESGEREKQLLSFIMRQLKSHPNWLLIYDNIEIEAFSNIKIYFPNDPEIWGTGKVIITSNDNNIQNSSFINSENIIHLGELTKKEALSLFCRVLYDTKPDKLPQVVREETMGFLVNIPPFPLDVAIAAYYIKNSNITFKQYLERVNQYGQSFQHTQESLLKAVGEYTKTRYGIITTSLEKLIEEHPDFKELTFFICLLNEYNIPRNLLEFCKESSVVDSLIRALRRYSFIVSDPSKKDDKNMVLSLHRSTRILSLMRLVYLLTEKEKKDFFSKITQVIKLSYGSYLEENRQESIALIPHLETLMKNLQIINLPKEMQDKSKLELLIVLGGIHYKCTHNIFLAEKYYTQIFENPAYNQLLSSPLLADIFRKLGMILIELGELNKALSYAKESIKLSENMPVPQKKVLISKNLINIGDIYSKKGDFLAAEQILRTALNKLGKIDNHNIEEVEAEADIYSELSSLYSKQYLHKYKAEETKKYAIYVLQIWTDFQSYLSSSNKKYDIKTYNKVSKNLAQNFIKAGQVYCRLGEYQQAIEQGFKKAQNIITYDLKNFSHDLLKAYMFLGMGEALLRLGEIQKAEDNLTESILLFEKLIGKHKTLKARTLRAEARISRGNLDQAIEDCNYILQTEKTVSNSQIDLLNLINIYNASIIYYKQKNFKESFVYFESFFKASESFCKVFLDEKSFNKLKAENIFNSIKNKEGNLSSIAERYLQHSKKIFIEIYGPFHPFVADYVAKN